MAVFLFVFLSIPGALLTNHLLRERTDGTRILFAVSAGAAVGALISALCAYAVLALAGGGDHAFGQGLLARDGWQLGAWITFGGPIATAAAVWKWRPRTRLAGDLRG